MYPALSRSTRPGRIVARGASAFAEKLRRDKGCGARVEDGIDFIFCMSSSCIISIRNPKSEIALLQSLHFETGHEMGHCLARVLDINPLGAKIETYQEILSETIHLTSVDAHDDLIEIVGQVAYTHKAVGGKYEFGVSFLGTRSENTDFALRLIAVCHKVEPAIVMVKGARPIGMMK